MAVNWTEKQMAAIGKSDCNLIVCAAAGSGKTAVLVERIIRKIQNPACSIDNLLVTTFTEAAASKMKADIKKAIYERLEENPNDRHLAKQALLINRADICTIHSFCMKVIKQNFQKLDIDPDFRICDENEGKLLRDEALNEIFEQAYESADEGFYELLDSYSEQRGDSALREIVIGAYEFVKSMPFYENWLKMAEDDYNVLDNFEATKFYELIIKNLILTVEKHLSAFRIAAEEAAYYESLSKYEEAFLKDISTLEVILHTVKNGTREQIAAALAGFSPSGARASGGECEDTKKYLSDVRKKAKDDLSKAYSSYFSDFDNKLEKLKESGKKVRALFELILRLDEKFSDIKKKRGVIDFNDIEHYCLEILCKTDENGEKVPTEAADALKEKYTEILIDEYQDANEMQETIFSLISRGNNIFMVGDLKQSIYRFRHTNPLLFKDKMNTYSDFEGKNQRVIMAENFRSRKNVIDCVNFIFEQISSETVGELTYDRNERLNFAASYPEDENKNTAGKSELILIAPEEEKEETDSEDEELKRFEAEAAAIARKIKELKESDYHVFDKNEGLRPLKLKDIVILMRSPKKDAVLLSGILEQNRIACFADVGGGYFDSEEIEVVKNILAVTDNPRQDIALLSVMRSPVFGFDENELVKIRLNEPEGDIYGAVSGYALSGENEALKAKCAELKAKIEKWRQWSVYMPAHKLIDAIYNDTGYYAYVGAMPGGDVRRANLRLLYKRAEAYEKTSYKGLFNFLNFIEKIAENPKDSKGARLLGENQDVVRIMSIHKSKGLEFPVVFVAGMNKNFNLRDLSKPVLMHKKLGIGLNYVDCSLRYKAPLIIRDVISDAVHDELLSEELRLLYVALTRAREKLYMTAYVPNLKTSLDKWEKIASEAERVALPVYRMREAKKYTDWVVPALMRCSEGSKITKGKIAATGSEIDLKIEVSTEYGDFEPISYKTDEQNEKNNVISGGLKEILYYEYENPEAAFIAQKLSVTELKRIINAGLDAENYILSEVSLDDVPEFLKEDNSLSATQRGSVIHYIMQKISLEKKPDEQDVINLTEDLFNKGFLSRAQADAADTKKILEFFESDIAKRMLNAKNAVREVPFEINIAANEVYKNYRGDEKILLQGIIDCWFEENGKIILLDYKTDRIRSNQDMEKLILKYSLQLEFYAKALEQMTQNKEIKKYIYFFSNGETAEIK